MQAAISGISALIDASGEVQAETELFDRTVLEGTVTAMRGETLYVRFGEWVVWTALIAVFALFVVCVVRRRRGSVDSSGPAPAVPATSPPGPTSTEPAPSASPAGDRA